LFSSAQIDPFLSNVGIETAGQPLKNCGEPGLFEQLQNLLVGGGDPHSNVEANCLREDFGVLWDQGGAMGYVEQGVRQQHTVAHDGYLLRCPEQPQQAQQRGFATPALSDEGNGLSPLQGQIQIFEFDALSIVVSISETQMANLKTRPTGWQSSGGPGRDDPIV